MKYTDMVISCLDEKVRGLYLCPKCNIPLFIVAGKDGTYVFCCKCVKHWSIEIKGE